MWLSGSVTWGRRGAVVAAAVAAMIAGTGSETLAAPKPASACSRKCTTADTTKPAVVVETPAAGSTVSGVAAVRGTATDNVGLAAVDVRVDSGAWQRATGTSAWERAIDTTALADGNHTITAQATDTSGNTTTTSVSVMSRNTVADTVAPSVSVTSPAGGATVSGTITVTGTSSDNAAVAVVDVRLDSGAWQRATGTTQWSASLDTAATGDGSRTITARATDTSGLASTATITVTVANGTPAGDTVVTDPAARYSLFPLGRTRAAQWGDLTGILYGEQFTNRRAVFFRNAATGATSVADLPVDSLYGWSAAATVMLSATDLWVFGGTGPLLLRHYVLGGDGMPASATLVETRTVGDSDSRMGDAVVLASGALVGVWHQQGANGAPQGQYVGYRSRSGAWSQIGPLTFIPTRATDQVVAQHPADGSVWLFSNPDAWGAIGAVHLSEVTESLGVDWTDPFFIDGGRHGLDGSDPENPNLALAPDPATGTLALAYQSRDRRVVGTAERWLYESRVVVARVPPSGGPHFVRTPAWAESAAAIGVVIGAGDIAVSYRPVDPVTVTFDEVHVARFRAGAWEAPAVFGTTGANVDRVVYAAGRTEFSTKLTDGRIHLRTF